jgi:PKD repeat protein
MAAPNVTLLVSDLLAARSELRVMPSSGRRDHVSAAKPVARFTVQPSSPSVTETVELLDCSVDPGRIGIAWRAWDFGDGTTSVGPSPVHRYDAPGSYQITLTLATFDGRTSRRSASIRVYSEPQP